MDTGRRSEILSLYFPNETADTKKGDTQSDESRDLLPRCDDFSAPTKGARAAAACVFLYTRTAASRLADR